MNCLLIIRPDRVGDVILSSSCIPALREAFPGTKLIWGAREVMGPLFNEHPRLDGFFRLPDPKAGWWRNVEEMTARMRGLKADGMVCLHPDARVYLAAWRAGIPRRVGYSLKGWSWTLTDIVADRRAEGGRHEAECNFDLLNLLGVKSSSKLSPDVVLKEEELVSLKSKLPWNLEKTHYVVIHPSAFSKTLRWPAERFAAVARPFKEKAGWEIVIAGSSHEDESVRECAGRLEQNSFRFLNLAGQTNLGELGWFLKYARLSISRDTGSSHLAAAVGCPAVVIFARKELPYGPTRWRPLSDRAAVVVPMVEKKRWETRRQFWTRGLAGIGVDEVMEAARKALSYKP